MSLHDLAKVIRQRWLIIVITTLISIAIAVATNVLATPLYLASTRLFVSTTAGASVSDLYQGNQLSQDRVLSYAQLIQGQTLAQRTIEKLGLDMRADQLTRRIKASPKPGTVLINVSVRDESPVRARDIANTLSDEFVEMVKELETPGPGAQPDARVVVEQRAYTPEEAQLPKKAQNLILGVWVGLLAGTLLTMSRYLLDNTVKAPENLEEISGCGVVGIIPFDKTRWEQPAISFDRDNSGIAEAFRKLRTNLQFLGVDNPPRVIVIISSAPSEGKSVTAINLALALAESDKNVVLVDGDMRRPSLHKYLDLVGSVGFSTALSGAATVSEVLQVTRFPRLSVLTAGPVPPNPSELLGSQTARKILAELRSQFDYVIVDSAPVLAVTDGAILSTYADGALIVARFGQTKREQLAHAVRNLRDVGATLLGSVFTMLPTRGVGSYAYYYYYSGRYGEHAGDGKAGREHGNFLTALSLSNPAAKETKEPAE